MSNMIQEMTHTKVAPVFDVSSILVTLGGLAEFVPPLTAIAGLAWVCLRIYVTILEIIEKRKKNKDE